MKRRAQRGVVLLVMLVIVVVGGAYFFVDRLSSLQRSTARERDHNIRVMAQAKQALIGWMAQKAVTAGEDNPGRLPCPEPAAHAGVAAYEGIAAPYPTSGANTCTSIGRLPWRTLGLDKLRDARGEPLWYVVGPTWRLTTSSSSLLINSNTAGNITVDGQPAIALIIAPGDAFNTQASTGCTARNQARSAPGPTMNALDYVECLDTGTLALTASAPSGARNDQVMALTAADVMPALEAAISKRMATEVAPQLSAVYTAASGYWGLAFSDVVYPFAAPFADPDTSSFTGSSTTATGGGWLPVVHRETFPTSGVACSGGGRCNPDLVLWDTSSLPSIEYTGTGVALLPGSSCWYGGAGTIAAHYAECSGTYVGSPTQITVTGWQRGGSNALWQRHPSLPAMPEGLLVFIDLTSFSFQFSSPTPTVVLGSDGRLGMRIGTAPPAPTGGAGVLYIIRVPAVPGYTSDHPLLDTRATCTPSPPDTCPGLVTGWFLRNEWHKLTHFAVAPGFLANGAAPRSCSDTPPVTCLQVTNLTDPTKHRAILTLAGRALAGQATRPTSNLQDYLDSTENRNLDSTFEQLPVGRSFNDRIVSVSTNP